MCNEQAWAWIRECSYIIEKLDFLDSANLSSILWYFHAVLKYLLLLALQNFCLHMHFHILCSKVKHTRNGFVCNDNM